MERTFLKSTPPKIAETAKIWPQISREWVNISPSLFKRIKGRFSHPFLKSRIIRGFLKLGFKALKDSLKGVLYTFKGGLKEITIFAKKQQKSQPPIFRFLRFSHEVTRRITKKKEVIWQD